MLHGVAEIGLGRINRSVKEPSQGDLCGIEQGMESNFFLLLGNKHEHVNLHVGGTRHASAKNFIPRTQSVGLC